MTCIISAVDFNLQISFIELVLRLTKLHEDKIRAEITLSPENFLL